MGGTIPGKKRAGKKEMDRWRRAAIFSLGSGGKSARLRSGRWSLPHGRERKVRTPQGSMPRKKPRRAGAKVPADGKCHREYTAAMRSNGRCGKGEKAG